MDLTKTHVGRTVSFIWHLTRGPDELLDAYIQNNRDFRRKKRAAFRMARRKRVTVNLPGFGEFADDAELRAHLVTCLNGTSVDVVQCLLAVELALDRANSALHLLSGPTTAPII